MNKKENKKFRKMFIVTEYAALIVYIQQAPNKGVDAFFQIFVYYFAMC